MSGRSRCRRRAGCPDPVPAAHDVWNDQKDDLVVLNRVVLGAKEIFEDGNRTQPGNAGPALLILVFLNAAKNAGLALAQADHLVDDALAERMGSVTPLMVTEPLSAVTSILIFSVTSWS
jgi:hypothetical protein